MAAISTLLAMGVGLWVAYQLANRNFRGKDLVDALVTLPLVLPPTVLGYYLLILLGRNSWFGAFWNPSWESRWCSPPKLP